MTTSEIARHVRAEIEVIAAGLSLAELTRLLAFGRCLSEEPSDGREESVASSDEQAA